jgi:hypothetical protein
MLTLIEHVAAAKTPRNVSREVGAGDGEVAPVPA